MINLDSLRLLGDQILVRCLGTADRQGSIWIPMSAQQARKIHQGGGDYLHRGEVLKCGPGDKTAVLICSQCHVTTERIPRRKVDDQDIFTFGKCHECGGELSQFIDANGRPKESRAPMQTKPGDVILYENRRDAQLHPTRFPSLGGEDEMLVITLEEQHCLAILETAEERKAA